MTTPNPFGMSPEDCELHDRLADWALVWGRPSRPPSRIRAALGRFWFWLSDGLYELLMVPKPKSGSRPLTPEERERADRDDFAEKMAAWPSPGERDK